MTLDRILELFGIVGLITVGALTQDLLRSLIYYARNKCWPPALSKVEQDCATKISAVKIEALQERNAELRVQLAEATADLNTVWQKTLSKV